MYESIDVPDRKEQRETLLTGPDGKRPVLVREPRPVGFRPPDPLPRGLGGDRGPGGSGAPPMKGEQGGSDAVPT